MLNLEMLWKRLNQLDNKAHLLAAVEAGLRVETIVAAAAVILWVFLAEIIEQQLPTALVRLRIGYRLSKELAADFLLGYRLSLHELFELLDILVAIIRDTKALAAVTAGPSCLLVITFKTLRDIVMNHKTDIGLIYTHAEGDRRYDHIDILHQEVVLILGTGLRI